MTWDITSISIIRAVITCFGRNHFPISTNRRACIWRTLISIFYFAVRMTTNPLIFWLTCSKVAFFIDFCINISVSAFWNANFIFEITILITAETNSSTCSEVIDPARCTIFSIFVEEYFYVSKSRFWTCSVHKNDSFEFQFICSWWKILLIYCKIQCLLWSCCLITKSNPRRERWLNINLYVKFGVRCAWNIKRKIRNICVISDQGDIFKGDEFLFLWN